MLAYPRRRFVSHNGIWVDQLPGFLELPLEVREYFLPASTGAPIPLVVYPLPDQVQQDERFANALQAQYDAEVDLMPHPYLYGPEVLPQRNLNARFVSSRQMANHQPRGHPSLNVHSPTFIPRQNREEFLEAVEEIRNGIQEFLASHTQKIPARENSPINEASTSSAAPLNKECQSEFCQDNYEDEYRTLVAMDDVALISNVEQFECTVCFMEIEPREGVVLKECLHRFCRDCLAGSIEHCDTATVKCPFANEEHSCKSHLQEREIKRLVTTDVYEKHLARSLTLAESQAHNSFHCKTPDCPSWCLFEDNVNTFRCPVCRKTNCLTCGAIHEGRNCRQFQDWLELQCDFSEEARKTRDYLRIGRPQFRRTVNQQPLGNPLPNTRPPHLIPPIEDNHYEPFSGPVDKNNDGIRGSQTSQVNRLPTREFHPVNVASTSNAATQSSRQMANHQPRGHPSLNPHSPSFIPRENREEFLEAVEEMRNGIQEFLASHTQKIPARENSPINEASTSSAAPLNKECQSEFCQDKYEDEYRTLIAMDDVVLISNVEQFECAVCFMEIEPREGIVLRECLHRFCRDCLAGSIEHCDTATVKCPFANEEHSCKSHLQEREIKRLVTTEVYLKHLARSLTLVESQAHNSFHCKTPDCPSWWLFEDNVNTFRCPVCRKTNCLTCGAIHEGRNCRQFQDWLELQCDFSEEARKTRDYLRDMVTSGTAMHCPRCQVILMKNLGCDALTCSMCRLQLCWATKGPRWGPRGSGDLSGGCRCMVNGIRCHQMCNYCH